MKKRFIKNLMLILFGLVITSCGQTSFTKKIYHDLILNETENGSFQIIKKGENVTKACENDLLFVSCVSDTGYKVDEIKVNNNLIDNATFVMPNQNANISVKFTPIISNIVIDDVVGGTIVCDKKSAQYGEEVNISVTPDFAHYGIERSLSINNSEIYKSRIYSTTTVKFIMPDTDVKISMRFAKEDLNFGKTFGDFDAQTKSFNSDKWDYSLDDENNKKTSITLSGSGDANNKRDAGFTYFHTEEKYFYFSTALSISNYENITNTYENRVGVFFGDQNKLATIGYYFKKYSANTNMMVGRKYASLSYKTGSRSVIGGYQTVMGGPTGNPTSDKFNGNDVSISSHGLANIKNEDFKNIIMRMGLVYDGINKKIHILLTDFDTDKLVYVRTINSLDTKWFSVNEDGSVKFGLYAETAFTTTFTFFDYEFSNDKSFIEEKYPNIKEA